MEDYGSMKNYDAQKSDICAYPDLGRGLRRCRGGLRRGLHRRRGLNRRGSLDGRRRLNLWGSFDRRRRLDFRGCLDLGWRLGLGCRDLGCLDGLAALKGRGLLVPILIHELQNGPRQTIRTNAIKKVLIRAPTSSSS